MLQDKKRAPGDAQSNSEKRSYNPRYSAGGQAHHKSKPEEARKNTERGKAPEGRENKEHLNSSALLIRRVSKTRARGRMASMSATIVVGDGRGKVAVCSSSAKEVQEALRKARMRAEARLCSYQIRNKRTLPYDIYGKYGVVRVIARRAPPGTGIIAGDTMRAIFESVGVKDVVAKVIKGRNPLNVAYATIEALERIRRDSTKIIEKKPGEGEAQSLANQQSCENEAQSVAT